MLILKYFPYRYKVSIYSAHNGVFKLLRAVSLVKPCRPFAGKRELRTAGFMPHINYRLYNELQKHFVDRSH